MKLSFIACLILAGISMVLASFPKSTNETEIKTLKTVDFDEAEPDNESVEIQRKRDSGYTYKKPIRINRPRFQSGFRGRFSKFPNQINRPFNQYGLPSSSQKQNNLNQLRPHNQYRQPTHTSDSNLQNQEVPIPTRNNEFTEASPIASQNDEPFRIGTANYLPPKNQKLPNYSTSNSFSTSQGLAQGHQNQQISSQNFVQGDFQDQRISDAALFLTQNAQSLSQLYGAPAPNQEYAPNNEYLNQSPNQQQNFESNFHSQTENIQDSQGSREFLGPLPSYASGILSSQETLQNIQSLEKDRLISQLRQALVNQAQFQNLEPLGRNAPIPESVQQQAENGPTNPGGLQLVSPSVFGGEQTAFGQVPFLSGSAISPPGFRLGYGLSTSVQVPTTPAATPQPQGPIAGASNPSGSATPGTSSPGTAAPGSFSPSFAPGFPQYGTYFPTFIPGTNYVGNVPTFGSGFLNPSSVAIPNHPVISSPTQFGIPIPVFPGQKPETPTLTILPTSPSRPGVQTPSLGHPLSDPIKPVQPVSSPTHPVSNPVQPVATPVHPIANPSHPVATPVLPIRPVTAPAYPVVTPVHPTYGVQPSFVNSLFIKPLKPIFPVYYYPNVPVQFQKPTSTTQPWNYAPTFQQTKPTWN